LDLSFCIIGDFNETKCLCDKARGTPLALNEVVCMWALLISIQGESVAPSGNLFIAKK